MATHTLQLQTAKAGIRRCGVCRRRFRDTATRFCALCRFMSQFGPLIWDAYKANSYQELAHESWDRLATEAEERGRYRRCRYAQCAIEFYAGTTKKLYHEGACEIADRREREQKEATATRATARLAAVPAEALPESTPAPAAASGAE